MARSGAVGFRAHRREDVSWPSRLCRRRRAASLEPGRACAFLAVYPAGGRRLWRSATYHRDEERQDVLQPEPGRAEAFIYNRTTGEFLGRSAKNWGLILLFTLSFMGSWLQSFSFSVGHASDSER